MVSDDIDGGYILPEEFHPWFWANILKTRRDDVREDQSYFEVASIVPFRCLMVATIPAENNVIRVESIEFRATCPDGWHQSPVFYAAMTTTEAN